VRPSAVLCGAVLCGAVAVLCGAVAVRWWGGGGAVVGRWRCGPGGL